MKKEYRKNVMIIEDDKYFRVSLENALSEKYNTISAGSGEEGLEKLKEIEPDLILLDIRLPQMDGVETLKQIRLIYPNQLILMLTAVDSIPKVVECVKLGAYDYLKKPISSKELFITIQQALVAADVKLKLEQHRQLQLSHNKKFRLVGHSKALKNIRDKIQMVAVSDATVLIEGETGTGKEIIARTIHGCSPRAKEPFVAVNCAAISKELVESEFFGYKRGAFTGAQTNEIGKFQLANHGTLLLDEVGDLPLEAQTKLLRVLEEQEFYPVGGTKLIKIDVRVLASTNKHLKEQVEKGLFRRDLYFRLNVFSVSVPPLRERLEDIIPIAEYYIQRFNLKYGKLFTCITDDAKDALLAYPWMGNIRELRNIIECVIISHTGPTLEKQFLSILDQSPKAIFTEDNFQLSIDGIDLEKLEIKLIQQALNLSNGNKAKAARLLSLSTPTFHYRLKKYHLE